ncbi:unnamed protein product [Phytophthora fragariaefolia]|uniref:Unnamed protein product n=1 Tax=Phytophthora fragariaefolia TaxID=1490495 RepID=A0A9W6Y1I4_9STRA|nr:unnamed protein product [Phytophthora fragariaefolia]
MDIVFGLPPDNKRRNEVVVYVDRFSKMVHIAAVLAEVKANPTARLFVDVVFRHHGMPIDIAFDRDPCFIARFWQEWFGLLRPQLSMSTTDHLQTDLDKPSASPDSTDERKVSTPGVDTLNTNEQHIQVGPVANKDLEPNTEFSSKATDFVQSRQAVIRFVQDAIEASIDHQQLNTDNNSRGNTNEFKVGSLVLLATQNLGKHGVSDFVASASSDPSLCWRNTATLTPPSPLPVHAARSGYRRERYITLTHENLIEPASKIKCI